ncbi:MAG: (Fe-S)-binding protein [Candidatus Thermoplasmatota archaeon]|nr:(Fe-S)-binding protein [Candidatus Thermoplasmatota archaeon]
MKKLDISKLDVLAMMQFDACTRCGECTATCPTGGEAQDVELVTPRGKILKLRDFYRRQYGLRAKILGPKEIPEEELKELTSRAYECTICGQCRAVCPAHLDTIPMWENMREFLVANGLAPLPAHESIIKSVENYGNPWMQPRVQRSRWAKRLDKEVKIKDVLKESCEVLYFVGCTAAYDPNIRDMAINTAKVLAKAKVDFGTLGNEEACCGSTLLRTGLVEEARKTANKNIAMFEEAAPSLIVTSCAGCYKTLKQDYPKIGKVDARIAHITEYVLELIDSGRLKLDGRVDGRVTFHDPCHLGRHNKLYDQPRRILESIPGLELVEMERNREDARCCGAGGGVKTAFPDLAQKISSMRVEDAERTGAAILTTSCPFCYQSLKATIEAKGSKLRMMDIMELVAIAADAA